MILLDFSIFRFSRVVSKPVGATRGVTTTNDSEFFSGPHMKHATMCVPVPKAQCCYLLLTKKQKSLKLLQQIHWAAEKNM